jgi:hypothetical protein
VVWGQQVYQLLLGLRLLSFAQGAPSDPCRAVFAIVRNQSLINSWD